MSQKQLARAAGVSLSWTKKIEQGDPAEPAVETVRRFAVALKVPTAALMGNALAEGPVRGTAEDWLAVRHALYAPAAQGAGDATPSGVLSAVAAARPALAANQFTAVRAVLPQLIRDASALEAEDGRQARTRVLNLAGWLLTQTRQWEAAGTACRLAADAAPDRLEAASAVITQTWLLLRQGLLTEARELATAEAEQIEPARFSKATPAELALWGRLLFGVTNAAIRDNRPGEAAEALSIARGVAGRVGREVAVDESTTRTFGPVSTVMMMAENASIEGQPDRVLQIAATVPAIAAGLRTGILYPAAAARRRHRLDVAHALVMLGRFPEALGILRELHAEAPEWLVQQRYARLVMQSVIDKRRTLTMEMRELADAVALPLLLPPRPD